VGTYKEGMGKNNMRTFQTINPVRKSSTFQRGGSFTPLEKVSNRASGALNPVFALKGIKSSSPLQPPAQRASGPEGAAGLSNGVKFLTLELLIILEFFMFKKLSKIVIFYANFS
jgi:hypothetical protein